MKKLLKQFTNIYQLHIQIQVNEKIKKQLLNRGEVPKEIQEAHEELIGTLSDKRKRFLAQEADIHQPGQFNVFRDSYEKEAEFMQQLLKKQTHDAQRINALCYAGKSRLMRTLKMVERNRNKSHADCLKSIIVNTEPGQDGSSASHSRSSSSFTLHPLPSNLTLPNAPMGMQRDSSLPSVYNTRAVKSSIESYFDTDYDRAKARAAHTKEQIESIEDAEEEPTFDLNESDEDEQQEQVRLPNRRAETSFQQASRHFFETEDIMKAVQTKKKEALQTQKLNLEDPRKRISKKDRYDYINNQIALQMKDGGKAATKDSFKQILKYSELLLINDDDFMAKRRHMFRILNGEI